jgi:hypothetical protein
MYFYLISQSLCIDEIFLYNNSDIFVGYLLSFSVASKKLDTLFFSCDEFVHYPKLP